MNKVSVRQVYAEHLIRLSCRISSEIITPWILNKGRLAFARHKGSEGKSMRANRVVLWFCFFILSIRAAGYHQTAAALAETEPSLKSISTPIVCAAMLVSLEMHGSTAKSMERFIQSLDSLRSSLEKQEGSLAGLWRRSGISQKTGFSLSRVERLNQIQTDLTEARGLDGPVVAFREFRGEQVREFWNQFHSNLALLNSKVATELDRRYPEDRLPVMHMLIQLSLLPVIVSNLQTWYSDGDGSGQSLINATAFGVLASGFALANQLLGPSLTQVRGLDQQMQSIQKCLNSGSACSSEISIASGTMNNTPSSLHRDIFRHSAQSLDVDLLANAAKFSRKTLAEGAGTLIKNMIDQSRELGTQVREALDDPRGGIRRMFFDSYFYTDLKTGEPVLLVVYRNKLKKAPRQGDGDFIWAGAGN